MKPQIILLTDSTDIIAMSKSLGPYKIAHVLRQHGFEVAVISHLSTFSINEITHLLENLIDENTLFVGVNNFLYHKITDHITDNNGNLTLDAIEPGSILPHGKQYNQYIKNLVQSCNPKCKLVAGGPTADDLSHNDIFDYIVVGYAEISVVNLAQHLLNKNTPLEKSHRSIFGPTIVNDSKAESYNFSNCTMSYSDKDAILPGETLMLEVGRGCIFKCLFCSYPLNGKKKLDFIRDTKLLQDELLDNYHRFNITRYMFVDDTFNDSVEKCQMIYQISQQLPFKLEWQGYIRLDLLAAHPETIPWLFDSGLRGAFFGIETLNQKTGQIIGKGGSREKLINTARQIKNQYQNTVTLHGSFILGLPHEPIDSLHETGNFLLSDSNPFDSWTARPLIIRPTNRNYSSGFLSEIDQHYEKYGYRNLGSVDGDRQLKASMKEFFGAMIWENDQTSYKEMLKFSQQLMSGTKRKGDSGSTAIMRAGLGVELDKLLNKDFNEIDWHYLDKLKFQRANEYKKKIFENFNIEMLPQHDLYVDTFTQWIKNQVK
jgi:hypothetical protein